ncbi:MAG: cell division protein FtsZ [Polaromonas sp.]|nr:MAG: cell division protein FtsZ [Polaromonas sp.]
MISLQIGLAIAGGVLLALLVIHSAWSARKNKPKQPTPEFTPGLEPEPADKLSPTAGALVPGEDFEERREPIFDRGVDHDSGLAALSALSTSLAPEKKPGLDALIDVIAPVVLDVDVSGEAALAAMPATRRVGSKPFAVEGADTYTGHWEFPVAGRRYSAFQCGVQLANRTGSLNQIEYSEFVMKVQAFADAMGGEAEFPDMLDEVARARELDQFASEHDAQLSFTVRALQTAWSPGYVQQSAAKCGFVASATPGRMVLPASQHGGVPVLTLVFDAQAAMSEDPDQTALRDITLVLDVPQVLRAEQPFVRLRELAVTLAASMDGAIIDDNGNLIHADAMNVISSELEHLYDTLDGRELSAGSQLARRLFS